MTSDFKKKQKGFIVLVTVLLILAVVLMVSLTLISLSINEAGMSLQKNQSSQAYYLANLCAEEALMTLKEGGTYTEKITLNMENGSCTILPIEGSWIIKVLASSYNQVKKMKIAISQINPEMIIDSWEEVSEF